MANKFRTLAVLLPLIAPCSGCVYGFLYTSTITPVTTNMQATPVGETKAELGSKELNIPTTAATISVSWDSWGIGDAAQRAGLKELYYADKHTLSILGGIWSEETIAIYGR